MRYLKRICLISFLTLSILSLSLTAVFAFETNKYGLPSDNTNKMAIYSITNSFNITINKDYMHYAEHDSNGTTLDNEDAGIPGVNLSLEGIPNPKIPVWYELNYSDYSGNSTYTGQLQNGVPYDTTDHIGYINYGFRAGYAFVVDNNKMAIIPNAGFEWMNWNRNVINPDGSSNVEHYRFDRYLVGIKAYYLITNKLWLEGEGYYTHGTDNSMDNNAFVPTAYLVDSSGNIIGEAGNYENQSFELGNKSGFLFGAKIGYRAYNSGLLSISPYISANYSQLRVDKSNTITHIVPAYLSNGTLVGYGTYAVWEPQSQTNELFIGFGVKIGF